MIRTYAAILAIGMALVARVGHAAASDVYITQAGGGNGSNCSSAQSVLFFNSANNWGSGASQIGPGTTVHLCGTFTGTAGQTLLTFQGSGSAGSPVTLAFEAGATLSAPYWANAIVANGQSWVVVDGGPNGTIQNTLNGTGGGTCPGGPCQYQQASSNGVSFSDCSHCTVQNLTIADIYDRTQNTDESAGGTCINVTNASSNFSMLGVTCHDASGGLYWEYQGAGNSVEIAHNVISRISSGIIVADHCCTTDSLTSALIHDNDVHDFANWSDMCCGYHYHHDGIHLWGVHSGATVSGVSIYNNTFGGDFGAGTAQVYIEMDGTDNQFTGYVFNNFFDLTGDTGDTSGGGAGLWPQTAGGSGNSITLFAYNNTFVGAGLLNGLWLEGGGGTIHATIQNDVVADWGTLFVTTTSGMLPAVSMDHNDWYAPSPGGNGIWDDDSDGYATLADWQSHSGLDAHSVLSNPMLNPDGTPQTGSPVIALGANLSTVCSGQSNPGLGALCLDKAGHLRPAMGPWDVGAFEYCGTGCSTPDGGMGDEAGGDGGDDAAAPVDAGIGVADGGPPMDASMDDARAAGEGGTLPAPGNGQHGGSGCGCRAAPRNAAGLEVFAVVALLGGFAQRRRRRSAKQEAMF